MSQSLSAPYFISYCVTPLCLDTQWRPSLYRPRVPSSPRKKSLLVIIMTLWVSDLCKRRDNGLGKRWPVFKVRSVSCCAGWRDRPAPTPHYQHLIYRDNDSSLPWSLFLCPGHTTTRGISVPSWPKSLSEFSINLFHQFLCLWIYLAIFTIPTINAIFSHLPFLSIILKYGTLFSISTEQKRQWWPRIVITAVTPRGSDPASVSSNIRQQLGHQAPATSRAATRIWTLEPAMEPGNDNVLSISQYSSSTLVCSVLGLGSDEG